jgi:hypothetical protein
MDFSATGDGGGGGGGGAGGGGGGLGLEKHMMIIPWDLLMFYVVRHKYL